MEHEVDYKIKRLVYFATFVFTFLIMIPLTAYVGHQINLLIEFVSSLIGLTFLATILHLSSFKYIMKKAENNTSNQKNIIFIGSVIYLEIKGIPYEITKNESKTEFAYNIKWALSDPDTEQLRCIFCSLCIHNTKGIIPNKTTLRRLQIEWESNLLNDLDDRQKQKLWKSQTALIKDYFNKNKSAVKILQRSIGKNINPNEMTQLIKETVNR